jgi:hypothetical protein
MNKAADGMAKSALRELQHLGSGVWPLPNDYKEVFLKVGVNRSRSAQFQDRSCPASILVDPWARR